MSLFFIIFAIVYVLFWLGSRSALIALMFKPLKLNPKHLFIYDFFYFFTAIFSVGVRLDFIGNNDFVWLMLLLHYFMMGVSWLLCLAQIFVIIARKASSKSEHFSSSRRDFFKSNVALAGLGTIISATTVGAMQAISPKLVKVDLKIPEKFKNLKGLKIVQLSDVHIGPILKKPFFDELVKRTNELKPDLVVITGDLVDGRVFNLKDDLTGMSEFESTLGTYYVTGNHEYYWEGSEWIEFVKSKGIHVFENTHKVLNYKGTDFVLGGTYDLKATRFEPTHTCSPELAFKDTSDDMYKILLTHQPNACNLAEGLGINLQLSGHTHGGQGFPWNFVVGLVQPYLKGLYNHKGMDLYVNAGTGFWGPPYRLGIPGEITFLTLS